MGVNTWLTHVPHIHVLYTCVKIQDATTVNV